MTWNFRISAVRKHGSVVFIDGVTVDTLRFYMLTADKTANFHSLKKQLYKGAVVKVISYDDVLTVKNKPIVLLKQVIVESKPLYFPHNYPQHISDKNLRYWFPTLQLVTNRQSFKCLKRRFELLKLTRAFFQRENALQVDIPVLEQSFGGAMAKPFTTVANYNKKTYYLRVAHELPLKRLIIAGFPQVYYIGSAFRNQDLGKRHSFQFTQLQYYTTSKSLKQVKTLVERLFQQCYYYVHGSYDYKGFDLRRPWPSYSLEQHRSVNDPVYHVDNAEQNPLSKGSQFESYVNGMEFTNSYDEQNDSEQMKNKPGLQILDQSFIRDLSLGMPSTVGLGIGLDRLFMAVLDKQFIRDVQTFPKI